MSISSFAMLLLAIYLILVGLQDLGIFAIEAAVLGLIALIAGILLLVTSITGFVPARSRTE
jgi:hypothetical protein